jgi:3-phosphoshikimate 1-carboxyvinyltransferase
MKAIPRVARVRGHVAVPPSKSYTNRALLLAAMSEDQTTILDPLDSDDSRYMLEALRKIGFEVGGSFAAGLTIGPRVSISANEVEIFVGNAGTAMRFLTGFLVFTPGRFILTGDRRMNERPIGDLVAPLSAIGCEVEYLGQPGFPPLQIRGKRMRGGFELTVDGSLSSQFVSALMMAGATLPGGIRLRISALSSRPYVEITRDILTQFGASVEQPTPDQLRVSAPRLHLGSYRVEGDYSSASYWTAAAAITAGEIVISGLRPDSPQGDRGFVDLLQATGCTYEWSGQELVFRGSARLEGGRFDCSSMPDVVPTLAAIAPLFASPVEVTNVPSLRLKESDRIAAVAEELTRLGAKAEPRDDGLLIQPGYGTGPVEIDPHQDHRLAMSFAVAGLRRGNVTIRDDAVVSKSYPQFWRTLEQVVATSDPL